MKLIVVDDDEDVRIGLSEYLKIKGFNVIGIAENGKEGFELYKSTKPDVVLMDLKMSNYDGFFGLAKIREYDPNAKVIIITANLSNDLSNKLIKMGASSVLYKPYEIDDVISAINRILTI